MSGPPWDYTDTAGKVVYRKRRSARVKGWFEQPDDSGGWVKGKPDAGADALYCPQGPAGWAERPDGPLYWVEGETDADAVAETKGLTVTHGSAGSSTAEQAARVAQHPGPIVVAADRDPAGYACALKRREQLLEAGVPAERVRVVRALTTAPKSDVQDHLAAGHGLTDLDTVTPARLRKLAKGQNQTTTDGTAAGHGDHGVPTLGDFLGFTVGPRPAPGQEWKSFCPLHELPGRSKSPSASLKLDADGWGTWYCQSCQGSGSVLPDRVGEELRNWQPLSIHSSSGDTTSETTAEIDRDQLTIKKLARDMWLRDEAAKRFRKLQIQEREQRSGSTGRVMSGAEFFLNLAEQSPALWGLGNRLVWADGEGLLIAGDDGTGKTVICHQLIRARLGLTDDVLGIPVTPAQGSLVYLAMDRPKQAQRAGNRIFKELKERNELEKLDQLHVRQGPLPIDVLESPHALADWVRDQFGSDVSEVYADSLKDLASGLVDDAVGAGLNSAVQELLAEGINWVGLHHQRKAEQQRGRTPDSLADVYGSRWLTAGMGSVLFLSKTPKDKDLVRLNQFKEPNERLSPMVLRHDRVTGLTEVLEASEAEEASVEDGPETHTPEFQDRMAKVWEWCRDNPGASKDRMRYHVGGKHVLSKAAHDELVACGFLVKEGAHGWRAVGDFRPMRVQPKPSFDA